MVTNLVVVSLLSYFPQYHYSIVIVALNVMASLASTLGVITVFRHGIGGIHGRSILFLTVGIVAWLLADLMLAYGHFILHNDEEQSLVVSFADLYWIVGYVFLSLHLFVSLKLVRRSEIHKLSILVVIIVVGSSITYNIMFSSNSPNAEEGRMVGTTWTGFADLALSVLYPVLDLILIVPSVIILTVHRKDYYNFLPWILSSLSLLTNAIADEGFVNNFIHGSTKEMWIWDFFYITDYIIIAGALYWYNRFHSNSHTR